MNNDQIREFKKVTDNAEKLAKEFPELSESVGIPRFTISDIGLNARVINNWEKKGLFLRDFDPGMRRKFDLIDAVWLKMVQKMRKFEISLNTIKKVKDSFIETVELTDENREVIIETILAMYGDDKKELANVFMQTADFKKLVDSQKINYLQTIIVDIIGLRNRYSILINQDGESIPFKHTYLETYIENLGIDSFFNETFLSISINEMLVELIGELDTDDSMSLHLLTPKEGEVLKCMKEKNVKSIEIQLSNDNIRQPEKVILTKEEVLKDNKRINEILLNQGYEDITLKTEKGKVVHFLRKEKRKLK